MDIHGIVDNEQEVREREALEQKRAFLRSMSQLYGYTEDEIREFLIKEFGVNFSLVNRSRYNRYLSTLKPKALSPVVYIPNMSCPICGKRVYNEDKMFGIYTRTKGWACEEGGKTHFIQWKANNIRRKQGLSLVFQEVNNARPV